MDISQLNILACPKCKIPTQLIDGEYLFCTCCKEKFVVTNNIPVFITLSNSATPKKSEMDDLIQYHLDELKIAQDSNDPRNIMPIFKKNHMTILDIGCGVGQTLYASEIYNDPQKQLLGLDIYLDLLIYGENQYPNIKFINASSENLPLQSEKVDLIISRVSLPYTNIPQTIKEISRVLKADGEIWITLHSFNVELKHLLNSCKHFVWKDMIFRTYVLLNGLYFHFFGKLFRFPFKKKIESFQSPKAMTRLLEKNGFTDITIKQGKHFLITAKKINGITPA